MQPVKLLERAASGAVHTIRHPLSSAAHAAGVARGLVGVAVHGVTVRGHEPGQESAPGPRLVPPQRPGPPAARDDVPPPQPTPPGESFATEPKATSRQSEHGGPGDDAEIDAWAEEATDFDDDVDIETPVGTTGADVGHNPDTAEADLQQPGTEPLMDPATAKAIKSESEMLRKAAERNPE